MTLHSYLYILTIIFTTSCDLKSADDYLKQGHDIGLTGNYKAAITIFDKAIQKNPKLKEAPLFDMFRRACRTVDEAVL